MELMYLFWLFCATLIVFLPIIYYVMAGTAMRGNLKEEAVPKSTDFGRKYGGFLEKQTCSRQKLTNILAFTSPLTVYWVLSFLLVPQAFIELLSYSWWFWPVLALFGYISITSSEIEYYEELGESTYQQILQQENPVEEALVLVRHYEKKPIHQNYARAKEHLLNRTDEVGDVFREAYARLEVESIDSD